MAPKKKPLAGGMLSPSERKALADSIARHREALEMMAKGGTGTGAERAARHTNRYISARSQKEDGE